MTRRAEIIVGILSRLYQAKVLGLFLFLLIMPIGFFAADAASADELLAGAAKVEITNPTAGLVNDPLYVKALVLQKDSTKVAIITVDAVAIEEIGSIPNDYLDKVRSRLEKELGISPPNVMINASHCHGIVCEDVDARTVQA